MKKSKKVIYPGESYRKLSAWRVLLLLLIIVTFGFWIFNRHVAIPQTPILAKRSPWFASYVDVTAKPTFAFEQLGASNQKNVILSFIVSKPDEPCVPTWGSAYTMDQANVALDLERRIARLRQQGGDIAISFGGLLNDELSNKCTKSSDLKQAYESVIERYQIDTIDLDLEQQALTDATASVRRAKVIALIQAERRQQGKNLAVWLTLPVAPFGLTEDGTNAVNRLLQNKVDLAGVNLMTMDYGNAKKSDQSMKDASIQALQQAHRQLTILYDNSGTHLNDQSIWEKIGATPMIGQNDIKEEVFSVDDAKGLNEFVSAKSITRISMWSANRDRECGSNYIDLKVVSVSCSGIKQNNQAFADVLSQKFDGSMSLNSSTITTGDPKENEFIVDDPKLSPYQIWAKEGTYLEGTKVVWKHNVYQAKWWTQGDVPNNPVLQSWQTPWELIGPVMPGEKPIEQVTLPLGTYPEWKGTDTYDEGGRVLFNSSPYQAKWWTKGNSPAAASSDPAGSPWVPLTQEQINEVIKQNKANQEKRF